MELFLISQSENNDYDTYDSAVVCAPGETVARNMNPRDGEPMTDKDWDYAYSSWCSSPDKVKVEHIGKALEGAKQGVVCSSFNAG